MKNSINVDYCGVVLCGGQSIRMGADKSELIFNSKTFLQNSLDLLEKSGINKLQVSGQSGIVDKYKNKGPLGGILTCMEEIQSDYLLFIPVDMPLLTVDVVLELMKMSAKYDISYFSGQVFPFTIKNSLENRQKMKSLIESDKLSIQNLFKQLNAKSIQHSIESEIFYNVNTRTDWNKIQKIRKSD
ncbi:MAG: molybdenum cofactor guanylyltransferase [Xanthomonadales bacterium]|nr:molybdenum cofactor guanylyltransferase [Xanthomonadales bacterium]